MGGGAVPYYDLIETLLFTISEDDIVLKKVRWCSLTIIGLAIVFIFRDAVASNFSYVDQESSTKSIREILDSQVASWNKGDLKEFMVGYWKSEKLTFFSGDKIEHGWQATYDRYQKRYQAEEREMGKLSFSDLDIEMLSPDTAWVRGRWKLITSKESPGGLFTLIIKKFPEGWRIVHDHTSAG
jgi:beta-aspartyl-peptidase (threonine type)